jgi:N6-L-threonylcarbamoyladenine synthase
MGMYILGIETSCDETAAAVVADGERELSNVVASQFDVHARYGGVVPELASRQHLRAIVVVVREAMEQAGLEHGDLGAVAVTYGPGLVGSLLVGLCYAKALSLSWQKPLIGVNHIEGHIHAVVLEERQKGGGLEFPALALVASGGHTHLFYVRRASEFDYNYRLLGRTRDDAAGEAFDKVAKLLGLGYPGGPVIDLLAPYGDPKAVRFSLAKMKGNALDFSFSGVKTAVLRHVQASEMEVEIARRRELLRATPRPTVEQWLAVTPQATLDLIASFQQTVIEELARRAVQAAEDHDVRSVIVSGGVAANSRLRQRFQGGAVPYPVYFPSLRLSTDNAAMIAAAAHPKLLAGRVSDLSLAAEAGLAL